MNSWNHISTSGLGPALPSRSCRAIASFAYSSASQLHKDQSEHTISLDQDNAIWISHLHINGPVRDQGLASVSGKSALGSRWRGPCWRGPAPLCSPVKLLLPLRPAPGAPGGTGLVAPNFFFVTLAMPLFLSEAVRRPSVPLACITLLGSPQPDGADPAGPGRD